MATVGHSTVLAVDIAKEIDIEAENKNPKTIVRATIFFQFMFYPHFLFERKFSVNASTEKDSKFLC